MNNTEFKWTDELVWEFLSNKAFLSRNIDHLKDQVNQFKESKQPKPEWEIIEYRGKSSGKIYQKYSSGWLSTDGISSFSDESIRREDSGCEIYQVKRLSNGEVFTIGDKFTLNAGCTLTIKKFEVEGRCIRVYSEEFGYWNLIGIKKEKEILFTTEDGVEVFYNDKFYYIDKAFRINEYWADKCWTPKVDGMEFSSKEKAEEYILMNKPLFSVNEIMRYLGGTFYRDSFVNTAKQKLSNDK